jgi:GTP-binding protein
LELYSPSLAAKPEFVAVSKSELTGSDEVRERLAKELGLEVESISAVTGQGLARLMARVAAKLGELPREVPAPATFAAEPTHDVPSP